MIVRSGKSAVYLRPLVLDDADSIAEKANDYDVAYNIAELGAFPYPYTREDALDFIDFSMRTMMNGSEFHFGIVLKETDELIGVCGLKDIDYKNRKCDIGYWLAKRFWGEGHGREAVSLLLYVAMKELGMNRVSATVFPFNKRSLELLGSLKFVTEGTLRQNVFHVDKFVDEIILSILSGEYEPPDDVVMEGDGDRPA